MYVDRDLTSDHKIGNRMAVANTVFSKKMFCITQ